MKLLAMLTATALTACLMGPSALAYTLSPPKTTSTLTGTLLFAAGGESYSCNVSFILKTHERKPAAIAAAHVKGKSSCPFVQFNTSPPWPIQLLSATEGGIEGGGWFDGSKACGIPETAFSVSTSGVWTLGPGCFSGTMMANPPVTIVP